MSVLILIACFLVAPLCIWVGYRAGKEAALEEIATRQAAYAMELRAQWDRNGQLLRARPAPPTHLH